MYVIYLPERDSILYFGDSILDFFIKLYFEKIKNEILQQESYRKIKNKTERENTAFQTLIKSFIKTSTNRGKLLQKINAYEEEQKEKLNESLEEAQKELEQKRNQVFKKPLKEKLIFLADNFKLSKQVIQKFLDCELLEKEIFLEICLRLKLEPSSIVDENFIRILTQNLPNAKTLYSEKVKSQCGTLRILDVARPIELSNLYVDVNILTEPVRYRLIKISDLPQIYDPNFDEFNRWGLGEVRIKRLPGLEAVNKHDKLIILGKPGSGKTSFLQHMAICCNQNEFEADRLPVFIRLKEFFDYRDNNDFSLLKYIVSELKRYDISGVEVEGFLKYGRILLLLDGLDEVSEKGYQEIKQVIDRFCLKYFRNKVILTCRIAAIGDEFKDFVYVEISDFNETQIKNFAKNWFAAINQSSEEHGEKKAKNFMRQLKLPENLPIKELVVTPILLSLACLIFQAEAKFPSNRSELYKEAIDILLKKWDSSKGFKRDKIYQYLSLKNKIGLLTEIASITFEKRRYFLKKQEVCNYIANYIKNIADNQNNLIENQDSEAILRSIEVQHGILIERARNIYSFCQLTIQEYFTAKALIERFNSHKPDVFIDNVTSKSWREVFLIAIGSMQDPDTLLITMRDRVNDFARTNDRPQRFLQWVAHKSKFLDKDFDSAAARAFYFIFEPTFSDILLGNSQFDIPLSTRLDNKFSKIFSLFKYKDSALQDIKIGAIEHKLASEMSLMRTLSLAINKHPKLIDEISKCLVLCTESNQTIEKLRDELSEIQTYNNKKKLKKWWNSSGKIWTTTLRKLMIEKFDIGHNWQFSESDIDFLKRYYETNNLLFDCIESNRNKIKGEAAILHDFFRL